MNNSVPQSFAEIAWDRDQELQTRAINAENAACERNERIAQILKTYSFKPYEFRTLFTAAGKPVTMAMEVVHPADAKDRFIVMYNIPMDEWTVQTPSRCKDEGVLFIAAVSARIETNKLARTGGQN